MLINQDNREPAALLRQAFRRTGKDTVRFCNGRPEQDDRRHLLLVSLLAARNHFPDTDEAFKKPHEKARQAGFLSITISFLPS